MGARTRSHTPIVALFATFITVSFASCRGPLVWNADLRRFIDDGLSIVSLKNFTVQSGGVTRVVVPSGIEASVALTIDNPRSLVLSCDVRWEDDSLFDSPPIASVLTREKISLAFTPSLRAERRDLVFDVGFTASSLKRSYGPEQIVIHCNTAPRDVGPSLDAGLDAGGCAFAAFRLPGSATDDDLEAIEITHRRADGTGNAVTTTLSIDDAALLTTRLSVDGRDLLGGDDPLNRYFQPAGISSGEDYLFSVVVIDGEGLRSAPAEMTSSAALYSVTYVGNGNTGGTVPTDSASYRQTKPVIVLGQGTLERTGYSFAEWNTAADGSATAYAGGDTFSMGPGNVILYAQWAVNSYTVSFDSQGGTDIDPIVGVYDSVLSLPAAPPRTGYTFSGWNTEIDGTGTSYAAGESYTMSAANLTLYAQWTADSYTLSFDSQGGSTVPPLSGTYAAVVTLPAGPTRSGYAFHGWNGAADGSGAAYEAGAAFTLPAGDVVLFAQWTQLAEVAVSFSIPEYRSLAFTYNGATVTTVSVPMSDTSLVIGYDDPVSAAEGWVWYVDGVDQGVDEGSYALDISQPGRYVVSCTAMSGGVKYAGSLTVTVTSTLAAIRERNGADSVLFSSIAAGRSSAVSTLMVCEEPSKSPAASTPLAVWSPLIGRRGEPPSSSSEGCSGEVRL